MASPGQPQSAPPGDPLQPPMGDRDVTWHCPGSHKVPPPETLYNPRCETVMLHGIARPSTTPGGRR